MKTKSIILDNYCGKFVIFWQTKNRIYIENEHGVFSTKDVGILLDQIIFELRTGKLSYIGDL